MAKWLDDLNEHELAQHRDRYRHIHYASDMADITLCGIRLDFPDLVIGTALQVTCFRCDHAMPV